MKQFAVIGIGSYGWYLACHLYEKGHEVLAIDADAGLIQKIKGHVSRALVADTTDPEAIAGLGLTEMDRVVVCIGSILSNSILTVLNLQELGITNLMAKSISEPHTRILHKIGVGEVFFPEKDLAISMAEKLHTPDMLDYLPFIEGHGIVQMAVPGPFIGKSLKELNLINRFGVQVVAIKEFVPEKMHMIPTADFVLKESDMMVLLGPDASIEKIRKVRG
ncbi:potassium channel family protein [Desulfoluna butyratoxydans]|uniref:Regulator of k+ conductance n-terminal n=1 Tax=Desulfoluna butyratoxydans TaxID=231438 RepID=A0A4U8YJ47_9BACT|nr:TrkA family potassium uptake protein [Desulfoluna butyratoxydans]VFQ43736.1 regulator of k+ conductance n-terminal [Desulfoluna butyratoxydans]